MFTLYLVNKGGWGLISDVTLINLLYYMKKNTTHIVGTWMGFGTVSF